MGSSTALHLIRSGYTPSNITVLDVYPIPSAQSAGYDLNKIMSIRLRNGPDLQLSLEALDMWKNDPLFKPFFHNVGMVSKKKDCYFEMQQFHTNNILRLTPRHLKTVLQIFESVTNQSSTRTLG